jgi:RHS repeat-associated protein
VGSKRSDGAAVAVREGFWDANFAIEATLTSGSQGGIAFRVQDKGNYFLVAPWTSTAVRLYKVANGQVSTVSTQTISTVNWGQPHDWYLRADGGNLDLAVYVGGTWQFVFDSGTTGLGVLNGGSGEGGVGLATTGESTSPVVCDTFTYGYDPEVYGAVTQVIGHDTFGASALGVEPDYDAAGNLIDDGVYQYGYDAWNRLVSVERKAVDADGEYTVVATYRYDGLGHRVYKKVENSGDLDRTEYYYYNQKWQLLEVDQGTTSETHKAVQQFVWGTNYIDEAICMDVDTNNDGDCADLTTTPPGARRFFHMQDANWNVVGLREGTTIVERCEYDPYGAVRIYRGSATSGAPEQRTVAGQSLKWLDAGLPSNAVLYAGYFQDSETARYKVRFRDLDAGTGRWMQRDPAGYSGAVGGVRAHLSDTMRTAKRIAASLRVALADGPDLYLYVRGSPIEHVDPLGLQTTQPAKQPCICGPDITYQLYRMMTDISYRFAKLTPSQRDSFCGSWSDIDLSVPTFGGFMTPWGWDSDLHDLAYSFKTPNCPKGDSCTVDPTPFPNQGGGSVTVGGGCYGAFDVNYVLFGRLAALCNATGRASRALGFYLGGATKERRDQKIYWYAWGSNWPSLKPPPSLRTFRQCSPCSEAWKKGLAWHAIGDNGVKLESDGTLQP